MKIALIIFSLMVASSSAGPFDGFTAVVFATQNSLKFSSAVDVEIKAALDLVTSSVTVEVSFVNGAGQTIIAYVTAFGSGSEDLAALATSDAAAVANYIQQNFNATVLGQTIMVPYNNVKTYVTGVITTDISTLSAKVTAGKVKLTCLQKMQSAIDGNITQYTAEIRDKKAQHYQKFQNQTAALNLKINADIQAYQQNITETCSGLTDTDLVTCEVNQGEALRPEINLKIQGYLQEAQDDVNQQVQFGQVKAQELKDSFNTRYGNIKADIARCSAA